MMPIETAHRQNTNHVDLRFASYNIHACVGRDGRYDPDRIARVIRELRPDALGLQEVDAGYGCGSDLDLLDRLALNTSMTAVAGPTLLNGNGSYGNAVLTRGEVRDVQRTSIAVGGREPRGVLDVFLELQGVKIRLLVTHFGLRASERMIQARELIRMSASPPAGLRVVAGDFNEWSWRGKALRHLNRCLGPSPWVRTFPSSLPIFSLDRIWVAPRSALARVQAHRSPLTRVASDHLPVVACVRCMRGAQRP